MNIYELNKIIKGEIVTIKKETFKNISTDTRTMKKDSLFIALKTNDNGYNYIKKSKIKPNIVIIDKDSKTIADISCIKVEDTIKAYSQIAKYHKELKYIPTIAITGSIGKTTTKEMIYSILSTIYKCKKTEKSQNNILGISKTLLELKPNDQILITELGSNHKGEIAELTSIVEPDIAIITNIGTSHIGNFKTKEAIYNEKKQIIKNNCIIFINGDDKYLKKIKTKNEIYKIGFKLNNDFRIKIINHNINKITFKISHISETFIINTNNKDLLLNAAIAIYIAILFNVPINKISESIENYKFENQRQNKFQIKNTIIIDDTYNASYESTISALKNIKQYKKDKIIILGDIYELGRETSKIHRKILKKAKKIKNAKIYTVGKNYKYKNNYKNKEELIKELKKVDFTNKVVLLKASRKVKLEEVVNHLKETIE